MSRLTHSPVSARTSRSAAPCAAFLLLTAATSFAQPVAYDGFGNGPRANLGGSTGGTGWTSPWQDVGSVPTSIGGPASGLTAPNLYCTPGGIISPGAWLPDMTDYQRLFPAITTDSMFVSFLMRPEADYTNWQILRFGYYPRQVDVGIPIGYYNYGLMIGDGLMVPSHVPTIVGHSVLLVLEIRHQLTNNSTVYSLYVDPVVGAPKPLYPTVDFARAGLMAFGNFVELRGEGGYTIDELRIGPSWESVTPTTPPCPADFNNDGFVNGADFDLFVQAFESGDSSADFDHDGFITGVDFDSYVQAFETGC